MKKILYNSEKLSEELIIQKILSPLSFNKKETFKFKNDGAYIEVNNNSKLVITTDSIIEGVDFFKKDHPKSIAYKIVTVNLSDLSAMGAEPYSYNLNLCLPKYIDLSWLKIFSKELYKLQKKYNFFLLGGDISKSKSLIISSTFFGQPCFNKIIPQQKAKIDDDIWITGNLGESFTGLRLLKKNKKKLYNNKLKNFFIKKYYFPQPCMLGSKISKYCSSASDISDGFLGDLHKLIGNNYGAKININSIPISVNQKKIINTRFLNFGSLLNCGDDYELIITSSKKNRSQIKKIAYKNKVKITRVGSITKRKGIFDDSGLMFDSNKYFDHFR